MFCKRMAAITKKARDKLEELREAHRAESGRLLGVLGDVLADVREALGPPSPTDGDGDDAAADVADAAALDVEPIGAVCERAGRMVLKTLTDTGGVVALSTAHETVSAHHGNNPMPLMERYYCSHRAAHSRCLRCWSWRRPAPTAASPTRWRCCARTGTASASTYPNTTRAS